MNTKRKNLHAGQLNLFSSIAKRNGYAVYDKEELEIINRNKINSEVIKQLNTIKSVFSGKIIDQYAEN